MTKQGVRNDVESTAEVRMYGTYKFGIES